MTRPVVFRTSAHLADCPLTEVCPLLHTKTVCNTMYFLMIQMALQYLEEPKVTGKDKPAEQPISRVLADQTPGDQDFCSP